VTRLVFIGMDWVRFDLIWFDAKGILETVYWPLYFE